MNVRDIDIAHLHEAAWNAHQVPPPIMDRIKNSVARWGIVENEIVRPNGNGGFEVVSGNHRLRIYRDLGMATVPCEVLDLDDANARLLAQTINNTRGEDVPEKAAALYAEIADLGVGLDEMVALLPETEPLAVPAFGPIPESEQGRLDHVGASVVCPECGAEFAPS